MTSPKNTNAFRGTTRREARLQIDVTIPLGDHHTVDELVEYVGREMAWTFDAEDVTVAEVAR